MPIFFKLYNYYQSKIFRMKIFSAVDVASINVQTSVLTVNKHENSLVKSKKCHYLFFQSFTFCSQCLIIITLIYFSKLD